eukprot:4374576-Amphidinium_carterae.1
MRDRWKDVQHVPSAQWRPSLPGEWRQKWPKVERVLLCVHVWPEGEGLVPFPHLDDLYAQLASVLTWEVVCFLVFSPEVSPQLINAWAVRLQVQPRRFSSESAAWISCSFTLVASSLPQRFSQDSLTGRPPFKRFFPPDVVRCVQHERAWPACQVSRPCRVVPDPPRGVSHKALRMWRGDSCRMHPALYEVDWLLRTPDGVRWLLPLELLRLLGVESSFVGLLPKLAGRSYSDTVRTWCALVAPVPVLAFFLHSLCAASPLASCESLWERFFQLADATPSVVMNSPWRQQF